MNATITYIDNIDCKVEFAYNEAVKNQIKELPGVSYKNKAWTVPIMHMPVLEALFTHIDIDPAVLDAYHDALRRMLHDFAGSQHRKGQLGLHIKEVMEKHARGIGHVTRDWQPTQTVHQPPSRRGQVQQPLIEEPEDKAISIWLTGAKNAAKREARQYGRRRFRKEQTHE